MVTEIGACNPSLESVTLVPRGPLLDQFDNPKMFTGEAGVGGVSGAAVDARQACARLTCVGAGGGAGVGGKAERGRLKLLKGARSDVNGRPSMAVYGEAGIQCGSLFVQLAQEESNGPESSVKGLPSATVRLARERSVSAEVVAGVGAIGADIIIGSVSADDGSDERLQLGLLRE